MKLQNGQRRGSGELLIKEVDPDVDPLAAGNDRPALRHCQAIARRMQSLLDNTSFLAAAPADASNQHNANAVTLTLSTH
jgi:hypothetical protein